MIFGKIYSLTEVLLIPIFFGGILCISLIIRIFDKNKHSFVKIFLVFFPKPYLTEFTGYVNSIVVEMFADCVSCDINYQ